MDRFIKDFQATVWDGDLTLCERNGVAYQANMHANAIAYDADYLKKCDAYDGTEIAEAVNHGRCQLVLHYLAPGARLLDYGCGSGAFVRRARSRGIEARGYDVMPIAVQRMEDANTYGDPDEIKEFDAVSAWDVLEHMAKPASLLCHMRPGSYLFVSLPIFPNLRQIRLSKHYRPGEHLYYWSARGLLDWLRLYRFRPLEESAHETRAGRESIGAFAFRRDLD